jgi:hypothetical protein
MLINLGDDQNLRIINSTVSNLQKAVVNYKKVKSDIGFE